MASKISQSPGYQVGWLVRWLGFNDTFNTDYVISRLLYRGCIHKVVQSSTECKPTVHKLLPAAQSDPETRVYERPVQPLRTHRATLSLVGFAGANMAEIFEFVDKQISSFDSAVRNVDFMAYFTREQQITLVCTLKYT